MPIPDYETLMLPTLRLFADGAPNVAAIVPKIQQQFSVTDEEATELLPSGRTTVLQSRVHWARTYLSKAGLLESPRRNVHVITELGKQLLASNPDRIDNDTLSRFPAFSDWIERSRASTGEPNPTGGPPDTTPIDDRQTP